MAAYLERAAAEGIETSAIGVAGPCTPETIEAYAQAGARYWLHSVKMSENVEDYERDIEELLAATAQFAGSP